MTERKNQTVAGEIAAVVFGSDQGLVGQFNDVVADYAVKTLAALPSKPEVWAVGERVHARLADAGLPLLGLFTVPNSVNAITPLVGQILVQSESRHSQGEVTELHLFYNRPTSGEVYAPVGQRLLPLDESWQGQLTELPWPTGNLPEVMGGGTSILRALIREYLFVSLFRACAESLASENASRLAAMQRADKNIDELLGNLNRTFHRLRQSGIDEELFDVVSGFESAVERLASLVKKSNPTLDATAFSLATQRARIAWQKLLHREGAPPTHEDSCWLRVGLSVPTTDTDDPHVEYSLQPRLRHHRGRSLVDHSVRSSHGLSR